MKRSAERDKMYLWTQRAALAKVRATGRGCSGGNEMKTPQQLTYFCLVSTY